MLLKDQPYPVGMNKTKILFLAQKRALKEDSDKEGSLSGAGTGEKEVASEGAEASARGPKGREKQTPSKRMRVEIPESSIKGFEGGNPLTLPEKETSLFLRENEVVEISTLGGVQKLSGEPLIPSLAGSGAIEKQTLLRFQAGSGWLGKVPGPTAPTDALGIFELGPDLEKLDSRRDEDVISGVKDALGVVCFSFFPRYI